MMYLGDPGGSWGILGQDLWEWSMETPPSTKTWMMFIDLYDINANFIQNLEKNNINIKPEFEPKQVRTPKPSKTHGP